MFCNWTVLFAQNGNDLEVSKICYDEYELRKIATALTRKEECDTLYKLALQDNAILQNTVNLLSGKVDLLNQKFDLSLKEKELLTNNINLLNKSLNKANSQKNWLKVGIITTSATAIGGIVYGILKN